MNLRIAITTALLLTAAMPSSAQQKPAADSAKMIARMQRMIVQLAAEAPDGFRKIKGAQTGEKDGAVYYKATLASIAKNAGEAAAMMTPEEAVVQIGQSTFYMATYTDDPEADSAQSPVAFAGRVFRSMADYSTDPQLSFSVVPQHGAHPEREMAWRLYLNGSRIGLYTAYPKVGKSTMLIGVEQ